MSKRNIKAQVIAILNELFLCVDSGLLEYVDLIDDFEMDSITFISIVVRIEAQFGITIPDDMLFLEKFKTVNDIITLVMSELSTQNPELEIE